MTVCAVCQSPFEPRRSTARFCGDRCRKRAARGTGAALRSRYSALRVGGAENPFLSR
jgi:hypothetical protein